MTVMKRVFPFSVGVGGTTTISYQDPMEVIALDDEQEYEIVEIDD